MSNTAMFHCTLCPWSGRRYPNLRNCPKCKTKLIARGRSQSKPALTETKTETKTTKKTLTPAKKPLRSIFRVTAVQHREPEVTIEQVAMAARLVRELGSGTAADLLASVSDDSNMTYVGTV